MYKTLKITGDENEIRFTSDNHHFHNKEFLWGKRGFKDVTEHHEALVSGWNRVCNENTIVFHLGDFIFGDPEGKLFYQVIDRLIFKELYLLTGNHNSGQRAAYYTKLLQAFPNAEVDNFEVYPLRTVINGKNVTFLSSYAEISINRQNVVLCHYPIASHSGLANGTIHIAGHAHGNYKGTHPSTSTTKCMDVGVEVIGVEPITFKSIKRGLENKGTVGPDHHGQKE